MDEQPTRDRLRMLLPSIAVAVGVPLNWVWLAGWASVTSSDERKPGASPLWVGVLLVLAVALLVAAVMRRWRVVQSLALVLMAPWVLVGLVFVAAFGFGVVLMVAALPWALAWIGAERSRRASAPPLSATARARRALAWSLLEAGALSVLTAVALRAALIDPGPVIPLPGVSVPVWWAAAATVGAMAALAWAAVVCSARHAWRAASRFSAFLAVIAIAAGVLLCWTGVAPILLLAVPALITAVHADALTVLPAATSPAISVATA